MGVTLVHYSDAGHPAVTFIIEKFPEAAQEIVGCVLNIAMAAGIYYVMSGYPLMQFVQKTIGGVDSFTLLAIPFFLLAGDIMGKGGISRRMLRFANGSF